MQQVTAPIIVSGAPRSGTTFTQALLSHHSRIGIHGQSGMWGTFWSWHGRLCRSGHKAAEDNTAIGLPDHFGGSDAARCRVIVGRLWRDFISGCGEEKPRWGWRAPWMCANVVEVEQVETFWPDTRWIVCVREPFRAWQSQRATYANTLSLHASIRRWTEIVQFIQHTDSKRVSVVHVDLWSALSVAERQQHVARLFDSVNEPIEPAVAAFVHNWPKLHHRAAHAPLDRRDRAQMLEHFPDLPRLMETTGYACEQGD